MMLPNSLAVDASAVAAVCQEFGVAKLSVFGSVLRDDFDPDRSDVDLLVEFLPGEKRSLFKLLALQRALTVVFGRTVEVTTPGSLSKYFRDDVLAAAEVLYDAA